VERRRDRWRCTETEREAPYGRTATCTDCSQRVGVFALRWYAEGDDVNARPDETVQRVVPARPAVVAGECRIFHSRHGDWQSGALQHARVGGEGAELLRCVVDTTTGETQVSWLFAARARAPGPGWTAAVVVAWAAVLGGLACCVPPRRERSRWRRARRGGDGRWRLDDGAEVKVAGVEGDEALVVMGAATVPAPYRDEAPAPVRVSTVALLGDARAVRLARRRRAATLLAGVAAAAAWASRHLL
jgi:hypothetical protein